MVNHAQGVAAQRTGVMNKAWHLVPLSLLVVAIAVRLVALSSDDFNYDDYAIRLHIDRGFSEYAQRMGASYSLPLLTHHWVCHRVFHGWPPGYLIPTTLVSLAALLLVYRRTRRAWPDDIGMPALVMLIMCFNMHTVHLSRYPMFTYANSFLVNAWLFFFFFDAATGRRRTDHPARLAVCLVPIAFFSNLTTIVPVVTGILCVGLHRALASEGSRWRTSLPAMLSLWPVAVIPVVLLLVHTFQSFGNLGVDKRPDMGPLFFFSSRHTLSFSGLLSFVVENSADLLRDLLWPYFPIYLVWRWRYAIMLLLALLGARLAAATFKGKLARETRFTLVFTAVTFLAILTGGLCGTFPFGRGRYADFLLVPLALLFARSAWLWLHDLPDSMLQRCRQHVGLPVACIALILGTGVFVNLREYRFHNGIRQSNFSVVQRIRASDADLVLVAPERAPVVAVLAPRLSSMAQSLGQASLPGSSRTAAVPETVAARLAAPDSGTDTVLVIAHKLETLEHGYPAWWSILHKHLAMTEQHRGATIWAGVFERP